MSFMNEKIYVFEIKIQGHKIDSICHSDNNFVVLPNGTSPADLIALIELYKKWRTDGLIGKGSFLGVDMKTCDCS